MTTPSTGCGTRGSSPRSRRSTHPREHPDDLRVLVGPWERLRDDPAASQLESGPATSGVYARLEPCGPDWASSILGSDAEPRVGSATGGLVAAVREAEQEPTWIVAGTDEDSVADAVVAARRRRAARPLRGRLDRRRRSAADPGRRRLGRRPGGRLPAMIVAARLSPRDPARSGGPALDRRRLPDAPRRGRLLLLRARSSSRRRAGAALLAGTPRAPERACARRCAGPGRSR